MNPLGLMTCLLLADTPAPGSGGLPVSAVVVGLLVVAVLWLGATLSGLRREVEALKAGASARPPVPTAPPAPAAGPSLEEVAAIAAAVRCLFGASARVVAVVPPDTNAQAWSREGRREVFQSHHIR